MKTIVRMIVILLLIGSLVACNSTGSSLNHQIVQKAIDLKLQETQQQLSDQLSLHASYSLKSKLHRVVVTEQAPLLVLGLPAYRVQGTYDATFKLPKQKVEQRQMPFEVILQQQIEGKTWRLAIPQSGSPSFRLSQPFF